MSLSNYIMRLVTHNPPAGREDWAQAMQAEFETLEQGKLGWALGCLATATGWRLRADAVYFLVILAGIILFKDIVIQTIYWFPKNFARPLYNVVYIFPYSYLVWINLPFVALCTGFGAWRPERFIMTGIAATLVAIAQSKMIFFFFSFFPQIPFSFIPFYSQQPFVAETALLVMALISAGLGAWVRKRFKQAA